MVEERLHHAVLLDEAVDALKIKADGFYVDGTYGRGGHSAAILKKLGDEGRLVAFDKDPEAVQAARSAWGDDSRFSIVHASFATLSNVISNKVDGILLDLGVSSPQLDNPDRGFSFMSDGPLDMRMNSEDGISAAQWLASADVQDIADVLKKYGEERFSWRIANAIVDFRQEGVLSTTRQLSDLIEKTVPFREKKKHPATRTFQAIRIFLNKELQDLEDCLEQIPHILNSGGRLVVISFHSLEDRIVKQFMRKQSKGEELHPDLPIAGDAKNRRFRLIGKMVKAGEAELKLNPRARSAVMRIAEQL